ncbi:hypothetical protein EV356DRAFT_504441 [Viridothelium virens]|uniref:BTB domain-containing protein n=1 Tax=Viridothelium virens TaxID=1048519 RepID=A0A6A6H4G4_VIRVR|nr:hypothetical protein EV356DRAFT_504441 [Viridothelium virens]
MGNPNSRGKSTSPVAIKQPTGASFTTTEALKITYPKCIDIAVKVLEKAGEADELEYFAQVGRQAVMRFSTIARENMKDKPEMTSLIIDGQADKQAVFALVDWMEASSSMDDPAPLGFATNAASTLEKAVPLYAASQIFRVPKRFTTQLRNSILRFLDVPLTAEQVELIWETVRPDRGITKLFVDKLVELRLAGLYDETAQKRIRTYVRTQPCLDQDLSERIQNIQAYKAEQQKKHVAYLVRQKKRDERAKRFRIEVEKLPKHRE